MLSSTEPSVDPVVQPSQDPRPPATPDQPAHPEGEAPPEPPCPTEPVASDQTTHARQSATPRDKNTPFPLPSLTPEAPQPATANPHPPIPTLSPQQQTAISLLLVGHSAAAAAAILGVHRGTLHRWKSRNPAFIAELNRRQAEALEAARARLNNLLLKTLDLVHSSLNTGKPWERIEHAYKLFKMLPCRQLAAAPITGPTELEPATDAAIRAAQNLAPDAPITHDDRQRYLQTFQLPEDP